MKAIDVIDGIKKWWDYLPGWHERIIWFSAGAALTLLVVWAF